jgi:2-dehydropantoate 2-reductase
MKIAVMGAGAMGGYFGGRLAQAGHDVWLIARGAHLAAMQADGLRITSPMGDAHITDIHAVADASEVGLADVILFMVKNRDVETAAEAIKPMLGEQTMVITCQNGVTAHERLGAIIGAQHVVPGVARIPASIPEPGRVLHDSEFDVLVFGEPDGSTSARCQSLADALNESPGATPLISTAILHDLWGKFCSQSSLASLTTLTGLDIGPLRDTPASARLFQDAIAEACTVATAVLPDFPQTEPAKYWGIIQRLPGTMHASMLDDLRAGKPLENEYLSGDVVRLGAKHGVPTPIHSVLYSALKPIADQLEPVE